jgi:hypothetical protein
VAAILHVTNGDAVVPEIAAAVGIAPQDVLAWHEILHDGPVPAGLGPAQLARVRARHLAAHSWAHANGDAPTAHPVERDEPAAERDEPAAERDVAAERDEPAAHRDVAADRDEPAADRDDAAEQAALADFRARDQRLAGWPADAEIALWFEDDLYDRLLLAQIEDRLVGRPGPVSRVYLRHPPRGDLGAAFAARERIEPDRAAFEALRSPDPRAWLDVEGFERLLEELPDVRTGLTRVEREILAALADGPLARQRLFTAVAQHEDPPWLGDASVYALAADLDPLVTFADGRYQLTPDGAAVLAGTATRPPVDRWLGGVHLGPGQPDWAWDPDARRPVRLD